MVVSVTAVTSVVGAAVVGLGRHGRLGFLLASLSIAPVDGDPPSSCLTVSSGTSLVAAGAAFACGPLRLALPKIIRHLSDINLNPLKQFTKLDSTYQRRRIQQLKGG